MPKKSYEVAYICNGKDPDCRKTGCYYKIQNGRKGPCMHTTNPKYAKNKPLDPREHRDLFDKFSYEGQVKYYERTESNAYQ